MENFKKLFGLSSGLVKKNCIISPLNEAYLFSGLKIISAYKGMFYKVTDTRYATIISSRFNILTGDCVLALKDTACRNIYLFGSCGGLKDSEIGDNVVVKKSFNLESFSSMLSQQQEAVCFYPARSLIKEFAGFFKRKKLFNLNCATVNSLLLEERYLKFFQKKKIGCLDMESSMVFSAAAHIKRNAVALLYVSDLIFEKPVYADFDHLERKKIALSKQTFAEELCAFIRSKKD